MPQNTSDLFGDLEVSGSAESPAIEALLMFSSFSCFGKF